jgi:serine phosphatase RsbU (regulator of sigma subunit)
MVNTTFTDSAEARLDRIKITKWKYHKGDDTTWAKPDYNDAAWDSVKTRLYLDDLPKGYFENIGWFRLSLNIDTEMINKPVAFSISHNGASEIYLNGKRIKHFGKVCANDSCEKRFDPQNEPFAVSFTKTKNNIIAVRYSNTKAQEYYKKYDANAVGFHFEIGSINAAIASFSGASEITLYICLPFFGFFIALSLLHLLIFLFYRKQRANLNYSVFTFILSLAFGISAVAQTSPFPDFTIKINYYFLYCLPILFLSLLTMIYSLFNFKYTVYFKICVGLVSLFIIINAFHFRFLLDIRTICISVIITMICFNCGYSVRQAVKQKKEGAWIITSGVMIFLWLTGIFYLVALFNDGVHISGLDFMGILFITMAVLIILSIPLSMSIYLARDFAKTNKNLFIQLEQVQILSKQTIEQEQEKQKILNEQNVLLEHQVAERTSELFEKNKEMTDSITYAKRLQQAILPSVEAIKEQLPNSFLYYQPKDIVAGDFYWMHTIKKAVYIAAADCTGHGVPGAMVSVVCSNALNRAVNECNLTDTGLILDKTRELVIETFEKSDSEVKDGMDISLLRIERQTSNNNINIQWSGANNSLWYIINNELTEVKADKQPIGKYSDEAPFTTNNFKFTSPISFYLFSDGYADQFSSNEKKLMKKKFKDIVLSIQNLSMNEQKDYLEKFHKDWKGLMEQTDDVLIIGVRV